ncbi:MAG TPA: glycosyltransferase [Coleofasciculaceae cyanobacterium]|jgi:glycosyltransferase involved in cell wall biosynthesis
MPIVSLIMTSYNRDRYIGAAIESILAQTYTNFELLVWDDGSTDRSVTIAREFAQADPRVQVIAADHQGLTPALKAAVASTTGTYVGWVDSDDVLAPTALAETVAVLNSQLTVGLVYTNYQVIDQQGNVHGLGQRCHIPYSKERLLIDFMTFHFRLLRRSVYDQVGGLNPLFERAEDYDLCLRLSEVTEVQHIEQPLYFYRQHSDNVTKNQLEQVRWAHLASTHALKRRGLSDRYEIDLKLTSRFILKQKKFTDPLVSIIIPCYNAQSTIEACLKSCFYQTYTHLEIIVVDNNSTDQTLAVVKQVAKNAPCPLFLLACQQQGANSARNYGLPQAKGHYVQWLDADDELDLNKIQLQLAALESNLGYDIAYGDWLWHFYYPERLSTQLTYIGKPYEDYLLQTLIDNWRPPHTYLLRRAAADRLHELQAWNPDTPACMDREYFTLAAILGFKFLYVPGANVRYNSGASTQITRSTSYLDRVQSLKLMFQRFQAQAQIQAGCSLQKTHWFLLNQSWQLWKPMFSIAQQANYTFEIQHHRTQAKLLVNQTQATIISALLKSSKAWTLEDHARRIVQQLWREIILDVSQMHGSDHIFNHALISSKLSQAIGLPTQPVTVSQSLYHENQSTPEQLISSVPLYTPLFGEQRLMVHIFLAQLQRQGWLES